MFVRMSKVFQWDWFWERTRSCFTPVIHHNYRDAISCRTAGLWPRKHSTSPRCCFNVGPAPTILGWRVLFASEGISGRLGTLQEESFNVAPWAGLLYMLYAVLSTHGDIRYSILNFSVHFIPTLLWSICCKIGTVIYQIAEVWGTYFVCLLIIEIYA